MVTVRLLMMCWSLFRLYWMRLTVFVLRRRVIRLRRVDLVLLMLVRRLVILWLSGISIRVRLRILLMCGLLWSCSLM